MTIKVLLINIHLENPQLSSVVKVEETNITELPTLHDYHVLIFSSNDLIDSNRYKNLGFKQFKTASNIKNLMSRIEEQTRTGGWSFCFCGPRVSTQLFEEWVLNEVDSYCWCPPEVKINNDSGDTFFPEQSEVKYYSPLLRDISLHDISWKCYFSEFPKNSRIIARNRAGYAVFLEVPNGDGKYVFLPTFKDREKAIIKIINQIVPSVIQEESIVPTPSWVTELDHPLEIKALQLLNEISKAKRVLFTKDKALVEASAFILKKLGFEVEILPKGTIPDLKIFSGNERGLIEIKGHENRQVQRDETLQILGYLSESNLAEKGIVISNHQFSKKPNVRLEKAFTDGAIQLANFNKIALLASIDLWKLFLLAMENKLSTEDLLGIRNQIMTGKGTIDFSGFYSQNQDRS